MIIFFTFRLTNFKATRKKGLIPFAFGFGGVVYLLSVMGSKVERENAFLPFSSLPPSIFCIFQEVALFYKERVSEKRHNRRRTERFLLNNFGFGIVGGHPYMTSAKFWDFLTSSPLVRIWD